MVNDMSLFTFAADRVRAFAGVSGCGPGPVSKASAFCILRGGGIDRRPGHRVAVVLLLGGIYGCLEVGQIRHFLLVCLLEAGKVVGRQRSAAGN